MGLACGRGEMRRRGGIQRLPARIGQQEIQPLAKALRIDIGEAAGMGEQGFKPFGNRGGEPVFR